MPTDVGGVARGPSPVDHGPTRLGIPGLGHGPRPASLTAGVCRGDQPHAWHPWPRGLDARQVAACSHGGEGHGELDAPPGLERFDDRRYTPGLDLVVACWRTTPQACRVFIERPDVCWKDHVLRRGRPDPRSEPAPVGRTPGGLAPRAESMPPQTRVAPERGGLAIPDGVFASPAQSAEGVVCDLGHRAGREVPRAHEPRPLDGVTTVGVDPVARLFRNHGRGDDPALIALFRHVALAPIPARAGFVDTDQGLTFRLRLTDALSEVTRSRANGPERGDLSTVIVSDRRHRDGCLMDIQTDVACVRVCHG
jgi:hypothetical protein